jgi:hypothetical protein
VESVVKVTARIVEAISPITFSVFVALRGHYRDSYIHSAINAFFKRACELGLNYSKHCPRCSAASLERASTLV